MDQLVVLLILSIVYISSNLIFTPFSPFIGSMHLTSIPGLNLVIMRDNLDLESH